MTEEQTLLFEEFQSNISNGRLANISACPTNTIQNIINQKNAKGKTFLHIAAQNGDTQAVKLLLYKKADPEIQNSRLQTAARIVSEQIRETRTEKFILEKSCCSCFKQDEISRLEQHIDKLTACQKLLEPAKNQ